LLKRTIKYQNPFTGTEVEEIHYFHISKADLITMEMEEHGETYEKDGETLTGMYAKLQRIADSEDGAAIMREFEDVLRRSYGKKDGDRFLKSQEIWEDFRSGEAYSQLLWEICTNPDAAAEFVTGVIPGDLDKMSEDIRKQAELRAKGIEAQAAAKAAASSAQGHPSDPAATPVESPLSEGTAQVMDALSDTAPAGDAEQPSIGDRIERATAENPVTLTQAEVVELDSDTLKSGLATGRIKLS
jgi:hypothetical protein